MDRQRIPVEWQGQSADWTQDMQKTMEALQKRGVLAHRQGHWSIAF
jgi:hypothetical protein